MDIGLQSRCLEALSDAINSDYCFKPAFNPLSLEGRELERGCSRESLTKSLSHHKGTPIC
jgi:hypothetical protein